MRASYKNRVEIIKLIETLESNIYLMERRVAQLRKINSKDFWNKSDVQILESNKIFQRARIRNKSK